MIIETTSTPQRRTTTIWLRNSMAVATSAAMHLLGVVVYSILRYGEAFGERILDVLPNSAGAGGGIAIAFITLWMVRKMPDDTKLSIVVLSTIVSSALATIAGFCVLYFAERAGYDG